MNKFLNTMGIALFFILFLSSLSFSQEQLTITTYYPSPYGSYNELTVTGNTYLATTSGNVGIGITDPQHKLDVSGAIYSRRYPTTASIDWNNGNVQSRTLANGSNTLTFSNGRDGGKYILILRQPASGAAGTVSWPASVRWSGGTAPTLTATNGKTDYVGFIYNGVSSRYDGVASSLNF